MRQFFFFLTLAFCGTAFAAETPMSGAEFDAYATGRTLTYAESGVIYGIEEYLPNRRVRWAFTEDECREGYWYEDGAAICFVYEDNPVAQCWTFTHGSRGLIAKFLGSDNGRELYEAQQSDDPLVCLGPDVGV